MLLHKDLTEEIIKYFYQVYNVLGYGFLEKVYHNAFFNELVEQGLSCEKEKPIDVYYKNKQVGLYYADIIVENKVILELKAVESLNYQHEIQLQNYLKATNIEVGLLFNFGKKAEFSRKAFSNLNKKINL